MGRIPVREIKREREAIDLLELELDGLEAGRGLHGPVAFVLRDLHDRGGGCGGLGTNYIKFNLSY